jgi:gluconolactonase
MTSMKTLLFAVLSLAVAATASSAEDVVVHGVRGPEGPLYLDGNLFFVAWDAGTLSKWDGRKVTVLNDAKGCGHNGLAATKVRTFLLACTDYHGSIRELDMQGKELRRWDADDKGRKFDGGVNDVVTTRDDGAYATIFGLFAAKPSELLGRILYRAPKSDKWVTVADNLNYANGIGVSPDQKTLYVSETVGNCILKFDIAKDGSLRRRSNFALLNVLVPNRVEDPWLGPDSMKVAGDGKIYVAQWMGGKVLRLSPEGKLLHVFEISAGYGTTNLAFGPGEKDLYITAVRDPNDPHAVGSIVRVANVR